MAKRSAHDSKKASAMWIKTTRDIRSRSASAASLLRNLSKDTAAAFDGLLDAKSEKDIRAKLQAWQKKIQAQADNLAAKERQAHTDFEKALQKAGNDEQARADLEADYQAHIKKEFKGLKDTLKKDTAKYKELASNFSDAGSSISDRLDELESLYEKEFQANRKLRSKEYRKAREESKKTEYQKLVEEFEELNASMFRRYLINPIKGKIRNKWEGFKDKTGYTRVSDAVERHRKRKDDLEELRFKIGMMDNTNAGKSRLSSISGAAGMSGPQAESFDEQEDRRLNQREVEALEKIAEGAGKPSKSEDKSSSLISKLLMGLPLIAGAIAGAAALFEGSLGKAVSRIWQGITNMGSKILSRIEMGWGAVKSGAKGALEGAKSFVKHPIDTSKSLAKSAWSRVKGAAKKVYNSASDTISGWIDNLYSKAPKSWGDLVSKLRKSSGDVIELVTKAGRASLDFIMRTPGKDTLMNFLKKILKGLNPAPVLSGLRKLITMGVAGLVVGVLVDMLVDVIASNVGLSPGAASVVKLIINAIIALVCTGGAGLAIYLLIEGAIAAYELYEKYGGKEGLLKQLKGAKEAVGTAVSPGLSAATRIATNAATSGAKTVGSIASKTADIASSAAAGVKAAIPDVSASISKAAGAASSAISTGVSKAENLAGSAYSSIKGAMGKLFRLTSSGIDVDGIQPEMQRRLLAMASEYNSITGEVLNVNSGKRSYAKQAELYRRDPKRAARPGTSLHEVGLALDASPAQVDKIKSLGLLSKYGLEGINRGNERQHIQIAGGAKAAASNGLVSGDYVTNRTSKVRASTGESADPGSVSSAESSVSVMRNSLTTNDNPSTGSGDTMPVPAFAGQGGSGSGSAFGPMSIDSVPTFSYQDHTFFALNIFALG